MVKNLPSETSHIGNMAPYSSCWFFIHFPLFKFGLTFVGDDSFVAVGILDNCLLTPLVGSSSISPSSNLD